MLCIVQIVNHHLLKDLTELGLWNGDMKNQLIASNGSIQVPSMFTIILAHELQLNLLEDKCATLENVGRILEK